MPYKLLSLTFATIYRSKNVFLLIGAMCKPSWTDSCMACPISQEEDIDIDE